MNGDERDRGASGFAGEDIGDGPLHVGVALGVQRRLRRCEDAVDDRRGHPGDGAALLVGEFPLRLQSAERPVEFSPTESLGPFPDPLARPPRIGGSSMPHSGAVDRHPSMGVRSDASEKAAVPNRFGSASVPGRGPVRVGDPVPPAFPSGGLVHLVARPTARARGAAADDRVPIFRRAKNRQYYVRLG